MTEARVQYGPGVPRLAYAGLAVVAFVTHLVLARDMGFRGDDWNLIVDRSLVDPASLMRPFNEQWIVVPTVIFRLIFLVAGMHSYLPYVVTLLALHLLVADGVRRLVNRVSGRSAGYLVSTIVLFLGVGSENLTWAFQIGMVLSAASGFWAIEIIESRRHPAMASALLLVAVASHAIGAVFIVICLLLTALRHDRRLLSWLVLPCIALAVWLVVFDLPAMSARGDSFAAAVSSVPGFILAGIATAAGAVFGLGFAAGAIVLLVVGLVAIRFQARPHAATFFLAMTAGLTAEYALIAISRAEFGPASVGWSRYLYVAVPLILVAGASWLGPLARLQPRWRPSLTVALVALTAVAVVGNLRYEVLARDLQVEHVHRARAAAAIVIWADDLHEWHQELQLPAPDVLRELIQAHGTPARDALLPGVVPPVPTRIADETCRLLVVDPARLPSCLEAVAAGVGSR